MAEKHPFTELNELVEEYKSNRLSFDTKQLQDMREKISLCYFYLSDSVSRAIANYDAADYERKRNYAELIERYKYDEDGGRNTVAVTESLARLDNKEKEEAVVEALRQKERVRIVMSATTQILNSISSRLNSISQK